MLSRGFALGALSVVFLASAGRAASAQVSPAVTAAPVASATPSAAPTRVPERFSLHAQSTDTQQSNGTFPATDSGPQSVYAGPNTAKTIDATLYLGVRVFKKTELYLNPELDQGFGLGHPGLPGSPYLGTVGAAGFTSGEAYKVGSDCSYGRVMRAFVRQTIDLGGGDPQPIVPDINQLGGSIDPNNIIVTAGKFSVTDVFDNNPYAHDPKHDFLNWSIIDMGAFDYAAMHGDTRTESAPS